MTTASGDRASIQTPPEPEPLLLLSGAGLQPWIWDDFVSELPEDTPVGIADRPRGSDVALETYVKHAIEAAPAERFTIVAHSLGAIIGLAAATKQPNRVAGLIAIAGVVPKPPGSFLSALPAPNRWALSIAMRFAGTRPPDKTIRNSLAAGLEPSVANRIIDDFEPDSDQVFRTPITRTDQPPYQGYVSTRNDPEMSPKLQRRFVDALAPSWSTTINSGHLPMLEAPAALADAVLDFNQANPVYADSELDD